MIRIDNLRDALKYIGYQKQYSPNAEVWSINNRGYTISIDFTNKRINYPVELKAYRETTKNFSSPENFVVLECITRLLSLGYTPKQIELEKPMPGGHADTGGYCDILIKDNEGNEFILIECKTADDNSSREFSKAWHRMQEDGGQLFNYFNSYRKAKALCLYTSDWQNDACEYDCRIVSMEDNEEYLRADSSLKGYNKVTEEKGGKEEYFKVWKNTYDCDYSTVGIFETGISPFTIGKRQLSVDDLRDADDLEIQKKYHEYATIMRQHNVSGRENAFDKLVNLFLAKIVDETQHTDNLQFYWRGAAHDDYYNLQDRLQLMYSRGMKEFLGEEVTYIDNKTIADSFYLFKNDPDATKEKILDYFQQLKFYTNNDFAFLDVHNQILFRQNAEILKKVVRMLQDMRLRTDKPNQFLGDLFEGFLDQGIKQSEGQFFTPMPIVRFIVSSLPLQSINDSKQVPRVIDYACGAGHFLNEYADQVKTVVTKSGKEAKPYFCEIYGVEKEYRLSKVAKVSAFMYGQDEINIIYQDALRPHSKLKEGSFSVLIANPPYSVKGFLEMLSEEERASFKLSQYVSDINANNSIEVFFIERAAQLLVPGGVAGIILPSSVLSNGNIYTRTREIILQEFDVVAIVEFGSGTFGKTGTNTVTLFLRKKNDKVRMSEHYRHRVQTWCRGDFSKDGVFADAHLLDDYCKMQGIERGVYTSLFETSPQEQLWAHELFKAYRNKYANDTEAKRIAKKKLNKKYTAEQQLEEIEAHILKSIRSIEMEKLYYYLLAKSNPLPTLIVKSPTDKGEVKRFLGYEWSSRKGDEGIKYLNTSVQGEEEVLTRKGLDSIQTPLFNPKNLDDTSHINTLVRSYYLGEPIPVSEKLSSYCSTIRIEDMIDFKRTEFDMGFYTNRKQSTSIQSRYPLITMRELIPHIESGSRPKGGVTNILEGALSLGGEHIDNISGYLNLNTPKYVPNSFYDKAQRGRISKGDILVCKDGALTGKVAMVRDELDGLRAMVNEHVYVLRCEEPTTQLYLFNFLYSPIGSTLLKEKITGSAQGGLNSTSLNAIQIPLPPLSIQQQIVNECAKVDVEYETSRMAIEDYRKRISKIFTDLEVIAENSNGGGYKHLIISDLCEVSSGGTPLRTNSDYWINGNIFWVKTKELDNSILMTTEEMITEKGLNNSSAKVYPIGSIIIAMYGATIGQTAKLGVEAATNQACAVLHCFKKEVLNDYIWFYMRTQKDKLKKKAYGSAQPNINADIVAKYPVLLPSLSEQKQIISDIENYEAQIAKAQAIMDSCSARKVAILNKYLM